MAIYLETNALRKLTNYSCSEDVYTSVFSIFELLSGISEEDFEIRKACLKRVFDQGIEVRGPMVDKLVDIYGISKSNPFAYEKIMDVYKKVLHIQSFADFCNVGLVRTDVNGNIEEINAHTWLKDWDMQISTITKSVKDLFQDKNKQSVRELFAQYGIRGVADYFGDEISRNIVDENRLGHAAPFIGKEEEMHVRNAIGNLFSKYNVKLFLKAQAAIFAKAYYIDGDTQNPNNASDLLHLLYINENDRLVSNDKIYQLIAEACPEFNLVVLGQERELLELV